MTKTTNRIIKVNNAKEFAEATKKHKNVAIIWNENHAQVRASETKHGIECRDKSVKGVNNGERDKTSEARPASYICQGCKGLIDYDCNGLCKAPKEEVKEPAIDPILEKYNQAIYDNVTPKSALLKSALHDCVKEAKAQRTQEILDKIDEVYQVNDKHKHYWDSDVEKYIEELKQKIQELQ